MGESRLPRDPSARTPRRERWEKNLTALMRQQYGCEPVGPGLPKMLDDHYAEQLTPQQAVDQLAQRFSLEKVGGRFR